MKTIILILTILVLSCKINYAQSLKGKVVDGEGEPLIGASVFIEGTTTGTMTDVTGSYEIQNVKQGSHTLIASYIGYSTKRKVVDVRGEEVVVVSDFALKEESKTLDAVVVTGTFVTRTQKETPASITNISSKKLQTLQSNSQADILRIVPGVHAEGGGGEVGSNVFVRGLPAGGQYQYVPIQIDGMPVESTFGMTSSATDVYFRNDLAIKGMEFVRGGSSTLYGVGSVAGIINYQTKTGTTVPTSNIQYEAADAGRAKIDFFTSGPLGEADSKVFYSLSGVYRYDEGPIYTGLPSEGYQIRGSLKKVLNNGSFTVYGQYIDDGAQFFLPIPLEGNSRDRLIGNDGEEVYSLQTKHAGNIGYQTPDGMFYTDISDGVKTKGGYLHFNFKQYWGESEDLIFNVNFKTAQYDHQFGLFLDGGGLVNRPETQEEFLSNRDINANSQTFTYADNGETLASDALLFENRILDRNRPFSDMSNSISLTKMLETASGQTHNISIGSFMSRMKVEDFNITTRYLGELNNVPRLVNVDYTTTPEGGESESYSSNGISGKGVGYFNKKLQSTKTALFLTDEMVLSSRLRLDIGFRYESHWGQVQEEQVDDFTVDGSTMKWGTGNFDIHDVSADAWAVAVAANYKLNERQNIYINGSKGYYFNSLRSIQLRNSNGDRVYPDLDAENIYQGELGWKFGGDNFILTLATYYIKMNNRTQVDYVDDGQGGLVERVETSATTSIGAESSWNWMVLSGLSFDGSITYQYHTVDEWGNDPSFEGNWLRRQPRFMMTMGLFYNKNGIDAGYSIKYLGKAFADNANATELEGYEISRLDAGYTFNLKKSTEDTKATFLRLGLSVFNLFDSNGITEGSPRVGDAQGEDEYFIGRPILPRRIMLRTTLNF